MIDRVLNVSLNDLSLGYQLDRAQQAVNKYESLQINSLCDALELFNIRKLLDNGARLDRWSDEEYERLRARTKSYNGQVAQYILFLDSDALLEEYDTLEWGYRRSFWEAVDQFKLFDAINEDFVREVVHGKINELRHILQCRAIVEHYKVVLRDILLHDSQAALLLIDKYIARKDNPIERELYLPANLTMSDKQEIISGYLDSEDPNINYVRLLCQNKDNPNGLELDVMTRLKAERLASKLNDEIMTDPRTVKVPRNMTVIFSNKENILPVKFKIEDGHPVYTYSVKYINECKRTLLLGNCISMFYWLNQHFLVELISKKCEVDSFEEVLHNLGRTAYPDFDYFCRKNSLAQIQLQGYCGALEKRNTSFEQVLKTFYEKQLSAAYGYPSLPLNFPKEDDSWLNKCRILFPELDAIVKQYNSYVQYDAIDPDMIRLSKPCNMAEGKSLLTNKYCEVPDIQSEIHRVLWYMFAPGALLDYVEPFKGKHYGCLFELLLHEQVCYDIYDERKRQNIDYLMDHGIVKKADDGILAIVDNDMSILLQSLWEYHACSYWHYSECGRKHLDNMVEKGWLITSDMLLTTEERRYFSYYMDNSEYTNGFAYRNHYAHGSTPSVNDERTHLNAYLVFLRMLAILILKIEDDLWCASRALSTSNFHFN